MSRLEDYLMDKTAETTGTVLMPVGSNPHTDRDRSLTKTIRKVGEASLVEEEGPTGEQVQRLPQAAPIKLRVDTTGKEAPTVPSTKEASYYALPSHARYPLDNYLQVKTAARYFDENVLGMAPVMRREYCQNLVKRASMLGIVVSEDARKYGAEGYASDAEVEIALLGREGVLKEASHQTALTYLWATRNEMNPEDFAVALGEFDKVAGIEHLYGRDVLDPYYSTFGEKRAEDDGALLEGNDYISHEELGRFAKTCAGKLKDTFGDDFVDEFRKDPVAVTKSLPRDQRKMVIRLASSTLTDPTTT